MNNRNPKIVANEVSVEFPIYNASERSLKKAVISRATGGVFAKDVGNHITVRALDGLSFVFANGDRVGLAGHNGAGKTSLLRTLAGVYTPTSGLLEVNGKIVSLLDISVGIDLEATGFENILLRGIMLGMSPREIAARTDEIAKFSELGDYLNMPVRTYSAGMQLRLAFAVSTSINAEIILMDEWLAVGDAQFNLKASRRLEQMVNRSAILVIASHSDALIHKLCNKKITLEHGRIVRTESINK